MKQQQIKNRIFFQNQAFTLVEILIAIFILQLIVAPVFLVFSSSKNTINRAKELSFASELASSFLASFQNVDKKDLKEINITQDILLKGSYSIQSLALEIPPKGFKRFIKIIKIDNLGKSGGPFFLVEVKVSWQSKQIKSELSYLASEVVSTI